MENMFQKNLKKLAEENKKKYAYYKLRLSNKQKKITLL